MIDSTAVDPQSGSPLETVRARCFLLMLLVVLVMFVTWMIGQSIDYRSARKLMEESGVVENATVIGYFLCVGVMVWRGRMQYIRVHWYLVAFLLFLALRELDLDKAFTSMGIFRTRFFLSPEVPVVEKIFGGAVVGSVVWMVLIILRRHTIDVVAGAVRLRPVSVAIVIAVVFAIAAKTLDGLKRKLAMFNLELTDSLQLGMTHLEEVLECGIPAFLLVSLYGYFNASEVALESSVSQPKDG